jgi:hypothetical protein
VQRVQHLHAHSVLAAVSRLLSACVTVGRSGPRGTPMV